MSTTASPPRENLIRAVLPGTELRDPAEGDDGAAPTLFGHFARFDEPTEIDSLFEGHFLERIAKGAFRKTMKERRDKMRVLFQHGMDPEVGDKPIAAIRALEEDDEGAYYEADLFRGLPDLILDGLRAGQYGASFRFSVIREAWDRSGAASDDNPDGLAVRTIKEASVPEFGPVTFPAYDGATAGVRSLTDEFVRRAVDLNPDAVRAMLPAAAIVVNTLEPGDSAALAAVARATTAPARASVEENSDLCDPDKPHAVLDDAGELVACYATPQEAKDKADSLEAQAGAPTAGETRDEPLGLSDLTPDPQLAQDEALAAPPSAEEAEGRRDEQPDAPSEEDAGPANDEVTSPTSAAIPSRSVRPLKPAKRPPIYGLSRKETSKPWLLGASRTTRRS